jgi:hypothetical protein
VTWRVEFHSDLRIVELSLSGSVAGPELLKAAAARIDLGQKKAVTNFLIDAAELIASKSTTLDVIRIPDTIYFDKNMVSTSRIAVVVPKEPESHWITEFYENAAVNRGWHVQVFEDRESALDWL